MNTVTNVETGEIDGELGVQGTLLDDALALALPPFSHGMASFTSSPVPTGPWPRLV
jgi:hypothetical protein